jgi:MarR family transcriptional regulator, temperature-dependent positive regulator of motility
MSGGGVTRHQPLPYETAPGAPPEPSETGLDPLTEVRLWANPCWLSARLNILANRFNIPMYGWIEERFGLTRPEFVALYSLNLMSEATAATISTSTGFPKNTLSRAVARLLKRKLISRTDDPADKRSFRLRLTPRGKSVVDEALPRLYAQERLMMAALDTDERAQLSTLMAKMVVALEQSAVEDAAG